MKCLQSQKDKGISNEAYVPDASSAKCEAERTPADQSPDPAPDTGPSDGHERATWGQPIEFLMSCISMSVGLGNVWRFPFTAYQNGGGAFLIPYLIVLLFIGKPLYFLVNFIHLFGYTHLTCGAICSQ